MDWVLIAVAAGAALTFLLNLPYLVVQAGQRGTSWSVASVPGMLEAYRGLLSGTALVMPLFLLLAAAAICTLGRGEASRLRTAAAIPVHEWSAAVAAMMVPAACFLVARFATDAFNQRYMLLTILGVIVAGAFVAHHSFTDRPSLRVALLASVALVGAYQMVKTARESDDPGAGRARQAAVERSLPDEGLPVVHGTRTSFMEATRYAAPALYPRMYYLTDRQASLKWVGNDNGQWAMANIAPLLPGRVVDYRSFVERNRRFLLVNPRLAKDWILPQLLEDGAQIFYRAVAGENVVLEVRMPAPDRGLSR